MNEYDPYNRYATATSVPPSSHSAHSAHTAAIGAGYRPVSSYMYGHSYSGYHMPVDSGSGGGGGMMGGHQGQVPVSSGEADMGRMPHPPPGGYSRTEREVGARIRRYQPT